MKLQEAMGNKQADVVLSDIAPEITGDRVYDNFHINRLNHWVVRVANRILRPGGNLFMKTFHSEEEPGNFKYFGLLFKEFIRIKPHASRKRSAEIYYLGKGFRLSEFFQSYDKIDKDKITFDQFYEMLPGEFTRSKEKFRYELVLQSQFLEKTGVESNIF